MAFFVILEMEAVPEVYLVLCQWKEAHASQIFMYLRNSDKNAVFQQNGSGS